MSALVALVWPKDDGVVRAYLARRASILYGLAGTARFQGSPGASGVSDVLSILPPSRRSELQEEASAKATQITAMVAAMEGPELASTYAAGLAERLLEIGSVVESLELVQAKNGIDLLVLSEDVTHTMKAAALWARAKGVPSVVLSHSLIIARLYTVHRGLHADALTVYGQLGAAPYVESGIAADRIVVTGNPAWDGYAQLVPQKERIKREFRIARGLSAAAPVALFATTWSAGLCAFEETDAYERSLRAFFRSGKQLRDRGVAVALAVKTRPSNGAVLDAVRRMAEEEGISDAFVTDQGLPELILASDVVVSSNSNVSIEAAICDVPAINLWTELGWFNGASFSANDGVLEASYEQLSGAMQAVISDAKVQQALRLKTRDWVPKVAANIGTATNRASEVLLQRARSSGGMVARYVWQEISDPRSVLEKGQTAEYYNHPRHELIDMLRHEPRIVLDIGCAGGATGAALKARFPHAVVTGIEMSQEAAEFAKGRIDRVFRENVETLDFSSIGFGPASIDVVFVPDVLEHLYDPWRLLDRLKPHLSPDAQVLASIPNSRNLWLLNELLRGKWDYVEEGLLDVTHIRFFTRKSIDELFGQTGYRIERWSAVYDPRVPPMSAPEGQVVNIDTPMLAIKQLAQVDLDELRTFQFLVDASLH